MKLTVITINRNNAVGLRKTIKSVVEQTFTDFEYIIIDGASTDDSVNVIKEYSDKVTYWVSEPDNGIYNAMNKGILKSKGEYLLFLNSGDWLYDKNVIEDFIEVKFNQDIISGNLINWDNGKILLKTTIDSDLLEYENFFYDTTLPHQATFIKNELFDKYGLYNEKNKLVSDWELFFTCLVIHNCSYYHFDRNVSYYDLSGISSQKEAHPVLFYERDSGLRKHLPLVYKTFIKKQEQINNLILENKNIKNECDELLKLRNGKFSLIIRMLLYIKRKSKKIHRFL